jgi:uncharacterized protein DUF4424
MVKTTMVKTMVNKSLGGVAAAALVMLAGLEPISANDSAAELSIGGLRLVQSNAIALESEDLRISLDRVSVRYQFANTSGKPVTLTVAFPLPDIDLAEGENIALPSTDPVNFVDFETRIDGTPANFQFDQHATIGDKDVSGLLQQLKLPLLPIGKNQNAIANLPDATRVKLANEGLLMPAGTSDKGRQQYTAGWVAKTSAVRQQTFPPDRKVVVEHQYRPSVGTSQDTILRAGLRNNKSLSAEVARYRKEYCISDAFLADLDKRAGSGQANTSMIEERRISYVLKTGANWAGPIQTFKLTVDPGASDRLVSFCGSRLKRSSPSGMEFTAENFKPDEDLKILIVGRF